MLTKILKRAYTPWNLLILIILLLAFVVRIYRIGELLDFHYDQGRDALVIWDLLYKGKMFLIGPTTGLAGVFRGPFYYYLIAPLYFLGQGNPIYPSLFLSLTTVLAIWLMYYLISKFQDKQSGLIAVLIASFSYFMVWTSRWLSNPTPMLLLSVVLVWAMYLVLKNKQYGWYVIALVSGLSLFNFGSSGELFYIPAILIFLILNWENRPNIKTLVLSAVLFIFTFSPLLIFDIKHDGILRQGIAKNFIEEKSFTFPSKNIIENRTKLYYDSFSTKLFHSRGRSELVLLSILLILFMYLLPSFYKNKFTRIVLILLISPLIGLYFYQGNNNNFYEYYLTGYYMIYIMLSSLVLGKLWQKKYIGKILVIIFVLVFLRNNYDPLKFKLTSNTDSPNSIVFINQLQAIDYLAHDSIGSKFNVDVYVPPVISYSYDYLFKWKGIIQEENQVKLLYTLYEEDSPHPERLKAWLDRQKGIGKVIEEERFGAITVQKRERI